MNVYRIWCDVNKFQSLEIDGEYDLKLLEATTFDATSKIETWAPPSVFVLYPKLKKGNFLGLFPGTWAVDSQAVEVLEDFFEMSGELLPLPYEQELLQVVNVTECINVLDQKHTKWHIHEPTGTKIYVESFSFHARRLGDEPLFKIPETCKSNIYTIERCGDPECEFKARVEQAGLTGLIFQKIWSDSEGPITVGP